MTYEIKEYTAYDECEILPLYESVGWTNYTRRPEMLRKAYEHSLFTLGAYACGRLIGILRAVGDGYSIVFVQDLIVEPNRQRQGVGRALLKATLARCSSVYQFELLSDGTEKNISFYRSVGLTDAAALNCKAFIRIIPAE